MVLCLSIPYFFLSAFVVSKAQMNSKTFCQSLLLFLLPLLWPQLLPSAGLIHRVPVISTGSLRTRLIRAGLWRTVVERMRHDLVVGTQLEFYKGFYTGSISMGTPPQQFLVVFTTATPNFWLINQNCTGIACVGRPEVSKHQRRHFRLNASSTLIPTGRPFNVSYTWNFSGTSGQLFRDTLQIGPLKSERQLFGLSDEMSNIWYDQPMDGIFGLSWPLLSAYKDRSPLMQMLDQLDNPVFTVWVDWRRPQSMGGPGGFITFGAHDNDNCEPPWRDVQLRSRGFWQISIEKIKIGRFRSWRRQIAIADTGTALIGCPHPQFHMIVEATSALYSQEDDIFTVNCSQVPTLPPIVLTINGADYTIPPEEYVLDVGLQEGTCALGLFGMYSSGFDADWVLGDIFFDTYCVTFDFGAGKLSLARAKDAVPRINGSRK